MIHFIEFGGAVIAGLKEKFDEATRRNDVQAIVLTGEYLLIKNYIQLMKFWRHFVHRNISLF